MTTHRRIVKAPAPWVVPPTWRRNPDHLDPRSRSDNQGGGWWWAMIQAMPAPRHDALQFASMLAAFLPSLASGRMSLAEACGYIGGIDEATAYRRIEYLASYGFLRIERPIGAPPIITLATPENEGAAV